MVFWVLRIGFIALMVALGNSIGTELGNPSLGRLVGLILGVVLAGIEMAMKNVSLRGLTSAIFGAVLGLLTAKIVHDVMLAIGVDAYVVKLVTPVLTFVFIYIGLTFSLKKRDEFAIVLPYIRFTRSDRDEMPLLLDTSAILDGRIFEVMKTGFLSGRLIVPRFVVRELQFIADSNDPIKRSKGREALDLLGAYTRGPSAQVDIYEEEPAEGEDVDAKLLRLAKLLGAKIITLDYNLSKVAQLEGIGVLNLNDLVSALQPKVSPGQVLQIRLVREGKEPNQAVGYTNEGTMVVVENARNLIGRVVTVEVYNTIQTASGRIIFARKRARNGAGRERRAESA